MKKTKLSLFQKILLKYRTWNSYRKMKILNTMTKYNFDQALYLANQKRDIINHKVWVIGSPGLFVVFARYQMHSLQASKVLEKHLTGKDLDEKASYIAYPVNELDRSRRGKIRKFTSPDSDTSDNFRSKKIIVPR
jgi:hypothetical protein